MSKIKVLIADDHVMFVEGLHAILSKDERMHVIGCVHDGLEVIDFCKTQLPDIILLDINMKELNGIDCASQIKQTYGDKVKIMLLSMHDDINLVSRGIKLGVEGYMIKGNRVDELANNIQRLYEGRTSYDSIEVMEKDFSASPLAFDTLSERELEIVKCITNGMKSTEIAEELFISIHTVKTHRKNILRKLELHNAEDLKVWALKHNLV